MIVYARDERRYDEYRAPMPHAAGVCPKDISDWLQDAGYSSIKVFRVWKRKEFSRFAHWVSL
jgi:hypothetical protein